jgi:hypothetical protein
MVVIDPVELNRPSGRSSNQLQSSAVVTEYHTVSDLSRSCSLSSVLSVISVVKYIYMRLRFVTRTSGAGGFLALCRAVDKEMIAALARRDGMTTSQDQLSSSF